jgi:hypothetical protein
VQSTGFNGTPSGNLAFRSYGKYPSRISDNTLYSERKIVNVVILLEPLWNSKDKKQIL